METFELSQDIDLSYIESQIEKKLAEKQNENMKKVINHPAVRNRKEKAVQERKT